VSLELGRIEVRETYFTFFLLSFGSLRVYQMTKRNKKVNADATAKAVFVSILDVILKSTR